MAAPTFTRDPGLLELGDKAEAAATRFLKGPFSESQGEARPWVLQPAGSSGAPPGVEVWRKPTGAEVYGGNVPPFRSRGIVRNVSPGVLMTHILSADKAGLGKRRESNKPSVRNLERVDWRTDVWYERTTYPWPVSDREYVYVERWREATAEDGASVINIARLCTEHSGAPPASSAVVLQAMCAQELRAEGTDTVWDLALEFNVGGSVPAFLIEDFLRKQTVLCAKITERLANDGLLVRS